MPAATLVSLSTTVPELMPSVGVLDDAHELVGSRDDDYDYEEEEEEEPEDTDWKQREGRDDRDYRYDRSDRDYGD